MPLSEEEQRILHEMEQKLYEHDRGFADRVRARRGGRRSLRWPILALAAGFFVVLFSFRSSLLLATFGFLVMLLATLAGAGLVRENLMSSEEGSNQAGHHHPFSDELSTISRKFRSRFWQQH